MGPGDDLAIIDASKSTPQFICKSHEAHVIMDILAASILTAAIVHTRKAKKIHDQIMEDFRRNVGVSSRHLG